MTCNAASLRAPDTRIADEMMIAAIDSSRLNASMMDTGHPLADLLGGLASDITGLFRKEIELAKAEASEKLDGALQAGRNIAIGAVLAIGAVGVLLAAFVAGLTAVFVRAGLHVGLSD